MNLATHHRSYSHGFSHKKLSYFIILVLFTSCVSDSLYKSVEPYYIFHGNSSKVWIENHIYENGKDHAPLSLNYKKVLVFHNTRNCYEYNVNSLGVKKGKKAYYSLNIDEKKLEIHFEKESWIFKISYLSEAKIILTPFKDTGNKAKIELITFPEY